MYGLIYTKFYTIVLEVRMVVTFGKEREDNDMRDMRGDLQSGGKSPGDLTL